jgi:DNA-binding CsgD family transcriptional regulator
MGSNNTRESYEPRYSHGRRRGKAARIGALAPVVVDEGSEMPQMEFLKNRFDLTPAEARLVARLITGESLQPCAKALGIKYETVRTYLKSVFQKTKTRRQAELVLVVIRAMKAANFGEADAPQAGTGDKTTRAPLAPML